MIIICKLLPKCDSEVLFLLTHFHSLHLKSSCMSSGWVYLSMPHLSKLSLSLYFKSWLHAFTQLIWLNESHISHPTPQTGLWLHESWHWNLITQSGYFTCHMAAELPVLFQLGIFATYNVPHPLPHVSCLSQHCPLNTKVCWFRIWSYKTTSWNLENRPRSRAIAQQQVHQGLAHDQRWNSKCYIIENMTNMFFCINNNEHKRDSNLITLVSSSNTHRHTHF